MTQNDEDKKHLAQRWATGCLEQSGREGLNSKAIETWWKGLLLLLKATPISQGHLINRQQLSPFQMVIFFSLNASYSMAYYLLQQTLVGFYEKLSCFIYYTLYNILLLVFVQAFLSKIRTSSTYNSELVVNEE